MDIDKKRNALVINFFELTIELNINELLDIFYIILLFIIYILYILYYYIIILF